MVEHEFKRYLSIKEVMDLTGLTKDSVKRVSQHFKTKYDVNEIYFYNIIMYLYRNKGFSLSHLMLFDKKEIIKIYNALK